MTSLLVSLLALATPGLQPVYAQIPRRHAEAVERLRQWIALPSIAAEGLNASRARRG